MLAWETAKKTTLKLEAGFQNDRNDRGNWTSGVIGVGELKGTKYGICAMSYPNEDIQNLTEEKACNIYRRDYWDKTKCDFIPDCLSVAVFDYAIHSGTHQAIKDLQKALGVKIDGIIGNQTIGACNSKPLRSVLERYFDNRLDYMIHCKGWTTYCKGWINRWYSVKMICEGLI
jgi:lysozyme family protein